MCGHVGVIGNLYQKDLDVFHDLLWAGALRGMHSTGIAAIDQDGKSQVLKAVGSPMMLRVKEGNPLASLVTQQRRVLMGHNRHATRGEINEANAHPFMFDNVVGAHNGTLDGRTARHLPDFDKYGTDSAALFANLDQFAPDEVIPQIEGAWALVWYDRRDHSISFLRNAQRPFAYAFNDTGQVMYYASEAGMLRWVLGRNNVKLSSEGILLLKEDTLVKFTVPNGYQKFGQPWVQELKGYRYVRSQSDNFFRGDHHEMAQVLERWSARNGGRKVESNAQQLLLPKPQDGKPNEPDAKPASAKEASSLGTWNTKAFSLGRKAGEQGKSANACPFGMTTHQGKSWLAGRLKGLEDVLMPEAQTTLPIIPAGMRPVTRIVRGWMGEMISEQTFRERTGGGCCSWCGDPQDSTDNLTWYAKDSFICESCNEDDPYVREFMKGAA